MAKKILLIAEMVYGQAGRSFKKAFEQLGHEVLSYQSFVYPLPQTQRKGIWGQIAGGCNLLRNIIRSNLLFPKKLLRTYEPDLVLIFKGTTFAPRTIKTIKTILGPRARLINWNPDSPFADYNTSMRYLQSIKYYDAHVTFAKHLKTTLETVGAKKVYRIPFWYDPLLMSTENLTITQEDKKKYECDLLFVGTRDERREEVLSRLCENYTVKIYGNNRDRCKNGRVKYCVMGEAVYGTSFVKAVRTARINLNILRTQNKYSHNMRNMEVPGCGGLLLTERSEEIDELFANSDVALYTWKDQKELLVHIENILRKYPKSISSTKDKRFEITHVCRDFLTALDS